jgi:hypothetical protein
VAGKPRRNGLFGVASEICGLQRLGGGGSRAQTGDPPQSSNRSLTSESGTEFFDAETEGPDPPFGLAETDAETRTSSKKPAVHGTNARITRGVRYLKTGWWWAQSDANRSQAKNREFSEKFSEKQASIELTGLGHRKLDCDPCQLREAPALSCYSAEQAFEARQQVIRCSTSGFLNLRPGTKRVESARHLGGGTLPGKALGDALWITSVGGGNRVKQTRGGNHFALVSSHEQSSFHCSPVAAGRHLPHGS